ncbi:ATP-binding protein [Frateuria edaphi]|uniref:ATP-dependent nuclease n=1 Tax=Frateuria edaphi TaxID=2898793 RepID=UPI001E5F45CB|nr:AAA family ATPase [Frateuria edaphi]UGB44270.1 ATP-binding protein [Frateuria edaphi]
MSLYIRNIEIRNFRSVRNLVLKPNSLSVLVGKNDSGKSNVLRALNLFFNGRIGALDSFNFDTDHNIYNKPNRRAREVSIKLEIDLPGSYRRVNGDYVVWEKRWRSDGLFHSSYMGRRDVAGPRGGVGFEEIEIPDRSNVHGLLRNINYVYVPAIKDPEYFSELRASIYNVISEVADRQFRNSSRDFERSISTQLQDLTNQIARSLGFQSRLALPKDLSHIFESLDFLSESDSISLDARGDGVKARHIPLILKFMADKKRGLQGRGAQPHTFIWGYEEPENSLELASCVELADQFLDFLDEGISQVFLTTHSPVFYNLHRKQEEDDDWINIHHMFRDVGEEGTKEAAELSDLDERMGTMTLFSPLVADLEDRVRRQEKAKASVERLAAARRRKIFVEGPSDKILIEKALQVFAPDYAAQVDVETRESAGINYVIDMLRSWRSKAKHDPEIPKAAGLLDLDEDARVAATEWNKVPDNIKSAKCFKLPTPPHILPAINAGFRIPVVLETLYDKPAWEWAERSGHLVDRDKTSVVPVALTNRIIDGQTALDDHLNPAWSIYVKKEFAQHGKRPMARFLANLPEASFRQRFAFLEGTLGSITSYIFAAEGNVGQED